MKENMKKIHLWLSIPFGIIFIIVCVTGAILVFQNEITESMNKNTYYVDIPQNGRYLDKDSILNMVNLQLIAKGDSIKDLKFDKNPTKAASGKLSKGRKSFVYVNPYNGQITGYHDATKGFFATVMKIHRWLLLPQSTGRMITGVSSIVFLIILISGAVRIIQINKRNFKRYFSFRNSKNLYLKLFNWHSVLGIMSVVLLLLLVLTGLMWSFEWYNKGVGWLFGASDSRAMMNVVKEIHFGSWGGLGTKVLYFIGSIAGAILAISGYWMWINRLMKNK